MNRRAFSISTCIVGSGPSAFYTAKYLLKKIPEAKITFLERLPTPFGLVRFGVAPDHAATKNCINDFTSILQHEQVRYFGNVELGKDVPLNELQQKFSAVVLAYGCSSDRELGIKGEQGGNILSARRFVNWYNGHPEYRDLDFSLKGENVVILGQGNVAIDCARILGSYTERLHPTDICSHAVDKLKTSGVRNIHIVGRRGPVQSACTNKELREVIDGITEIQGVVNPADLKISPAEEAEVKKSRPTKRKMEIFARAKAELSPEHRNIIFDFFLAPKEFSLDTEGNVQSVICERCKLENGRAVGTGEMTEIPAQMVLTSIGYRGTLDDPSVPFDEKSSTLISSQGRISPGLYCSGWIKRGPSGVIATNIPDAQETVNSIVSDWESKQLQDGTEEWVPKGSFVSKQDWKKIDDTEVSNGESKGKPREKMVDIGAMLSICHS